MGRTVKDTKLDSRESRLKLKESHEPYWRLIHQGLHLGYRKGASGGVWIVRTWNGQKYCKDKLARADDLQDSNGQDVLTFREAQARALQCTAPQLKTKNITIGDAAQYYMEWFTKHRKSHKNTQTYLNAHILPSLGKIRICDLKTRDIRGWHENLASTPARKRTSMGKKQVFSDKDEADDSKRARKASANRMLTILKALLNKAYQDELVADDGVWRRVKPFPNTDEPVIRFLTVDECQQLIDGCPSDFRAMVKAALFTGARYGELASLKIEDLGLDTGKIFIRPGKNGKGRHIPLSPEGIDFFKIINRGRRRDENVFVRQNGSAWGRDYQHRPMKEACSNAQIEPAIGFHDLRHTYASLLAQAGVDLLTISKLLGHADTRITSRHYAHLCDKTLATAVHKFLPAFGHDIHADVPDSVSS